MGVKIDARNDVVTVDDRLITVSKKDLTYIMLYKPRYVLSTTSDDLGQRKTVLDYVDFKTRLYPVGRLDFHSEGLILLTNDGEFAQEMAHPKFGVPKTYAVLVRGSVGPEAIQKVRGGVWLSEGRTSGAELRIERRGRDKTYLKVVLREGKNREIRRIFAKLGNPVLTLKRIRIGGLTLHGLRSGKHRFLKSEEIQNLRSIARRGSLEAN